MAEPAVDVEEVAGAAADIEDAFACAEIELEIAHTADVDLEPLSQIQIFFRRLTWIVYAVPPLDFAERIEVDRAHDVLGTNAINEAPRE